MRTVDWNTRCIFGRLLNETTIWMENLILSQTESASKYFRRSWIPIAFCIVLFISGNWFNLNFGSLDSCAENYMHAALFEISSFRRLNLHGRFVWITTQFRQTWNPFLLFDGEKNKATAGQRHQMWVWVSVFHCYYARCVNRQRFYMDINCKNYTVRYCVLR